MIRTNEHGQPIGDPVPGWRARNPPGTVILQGRYVRLEPVADDHARDLFDSLGHEDDDRLWTYRHDAQLVIIRAKWSTSAGRSSCR